MKLPEKKEFNEKRLQNDMKKQGRPWCIGKGFDHSAPIGAITPAALTVTAQALDTAQCAVELIKVDCDA